MMHSLLAGYPYEAFMKGHQGSPKLPISHVRSPAAVRITGGTTRAPTRQPSTPTSLVGEPISSDTRAGGRCRRALYNLRHSVISLLIAQGVSIVEVVRQANRFLTRSLRHSG